jgi:hypothetical protein
MMLPNPSNLREAYVFSSRDCALVSIRHGMFVMLRATTRLTIIHVQTHQITTLLMVRRVSLLYGLRFARPGSSEFISIININVAS